MTRDFLPQFRRQLFEWLEFRLAHGRTPFRRVEETPLVLTGNRRAAPDLVLWINRDSLLAGAMIIIPPRVEPTLLQEASLTANSLGLRQFVTWEPRAVNVWAADADYPVLLQGWPMPAAEDVSTGDFAVMFEQLLQTVKKLAISTVLPAGQLPPAYFANLCRQVLRDIEPSLVSAARVAAETGQSDTDTLRRARAKGWMTLWRLLTLLWHDRLPTAINPERLDRALGYALADLDQNLFRCLAPMTDESPLPESAAIRFHHLAGRLAQLGWQHDASRARICLDLLFGEVAGECQLETGPLMPPPGDAELLVNHLPPQSLAGTTLVAPQPCLAGLALTTSVAGQFLPTRIFPTVAALATDGKFQRIVAALSDTQPPSAAERRQRRAALRHPWPYRRFSLESGTPAWLWDALHLGGLINPEGRLQLTLPADWIKIPGAGLLWQALAERLVLAELFQQQDGRQRLTLVGQELAPDTLVIRSPDGTCRQLPPLPEDATLAVLAALPLPFGGPPVIAPRNRRLRPVMAEEIAVKVFRDGLPRFPEHYLRRFDRPHMRTYRLPGPLHASSHFFDRVRLTGPDGTFVDADHPIDAEALLLASFDGRAEVDLPTDPALTVRLIALYRDDLQSLWQDLLDECRRHHSRQRDALSLARRLWRERRLPPIASS